MSPPIITVCPFLTFTVVLNCLRFIVGSCTRYGKFPAESGVPKFCDKRLTRSEVMGVMFMEISPLSLIKGTMPIIIPERRVLVFTVKVVTGGVLVVVVVWICEI
jgi:hypothetical protein